jgi:hypothetical protein
MTAKLELKTASGGKVILDPTDTAVDQTLTLPALSGSFVTADTSGNVGIGTSSPTTNLTVGNASGANGIAITQRSDSSTTSGMLFLSDSVGSTALRTVSGDLVVSTGATIGSSSGTERMRITSTGGIEAQSNIANGAYIRGSTISVASNATINLTSSIAGGALIIVYETNGGQGGVFFANFSSTVVKIAGNGEDTDTGSTFAVYKSSSSHTTTFKSRRADTRTYSIAVYSARAF